MTLDPGRKIGVYEVVALIGQGGMGEVNQARDTRLDRSVETSDQAMALETSELGVGEGRDPSLR